MHTILPPTPTPILTQTTGYMKLAQLVQYLPLPVVGGYLGFVGYFCFASGVSLATNMRIASPASWIALCQDRGALLLLAPAVLTWLVLWVGTARFRHPLALPLLLCAVPLVFYAVLYGMGYTLEDAQRSGWVKPPSVSGFCFYSFFSGCVGVVGGCCGPLILAYHHPHVPPSTPTHHHPLTGARSPSILESMAGIQHIRVPQWCVLGSPACAGWVAGCIVFCSCIWQQHGCGSCTTESCMPTGL